MGRKTSAKAEATVRQERWARFRLMLRNREFQEELRRFKRPAGEVVAELGGVRQYIVALDSFKLKWGVEAPLLFGQYANALPELSDQTVHLFERTAAQHSVERYLYDDPVEVMDTGTFDEYDVGSLRHGDIIIRVDPRYVPLQTILEMIESKLREWIGSAKKYGSTDTYAREGKRLRLDKIDFQIDVFDKIASCLSKNGKLSFIQVGKQLRKPPSSIRSAYWSACYKIGIDPVSRSFRPPDPGDFSACKDAACRAAQSEITLQLALDKLCDAHRVFYERFSLTPSSECLPHKPI